MPHAPKSLTAPLTLPCGATRITKSAMGNQVRLRARPLTGPFGPKFPVGIKINSSDFKKEGFTEDEALALEGIDLVEISGGNDEAPTMMGARKKGAPISSSLPNGPHRR